MNEIGAEDRSDASLIQQSLTTPSSFAVLFDRHAGPLHRYLKKRVGPDDAEDLVGETFAIAFRVRSTFDLERADARPWLFGIATNLAHHHWRTEARRMNRDASVDHRPIGDHDPSEDATTRVFFESQLHPIASALGQLNAIHLDVILLASGPGFTYEEISSALGISLGTVRSRLSRARHLLRVALGDSHRYLGETTDEHPGITAEGSL